MSIHKLLNLLGNFKSLQGFSEKRLVQKGPEGGPKGTTPETSRQKLTPEALQKAKNTVMGKSVEARKKATPAVKEDPKEKAVDDFLENMDDKKMEKILEAGVVEITVGKEKKLVDLNELTSGQVDSLVGYLDKNNKHYDKFLSKISINRENGKINIGQINKASKKELIDHYKTKPVQLKDLLDKILSTPTSANQTIASIESDFASDGGLLEAALLLMLEKGDGILKKLSPKTIAIYLNKNGLADDRLFKEITDYQKGYLLHTDLKPEIKTQVFDGLLKDGLKNLEPRALESLVFYAFNVAGKLASLVAEIGKAPDVIAKMPIYGTLKLIVESFKQKGLEALQKQLLAKVPTAIKIQILKRAKNLDPKIRKAIFDSIPADQRPKELTPKTKAEQVKENKDKLAKQQKEFLKKTADKNFKKCAEKKINTVEGLSTVGRSITFTIKGVSRSFLKSDKFYREIATDKYNSPLSVKLACYKRLLDIIVKDGSIKSNRHGLKGDWKGSNAELQASIKKFEEMIAKLDKGDREPDKKTMSGNVAAKPAIKPAAKKAPAKTKPAATTGGTATGAPASTGGTAPAAEPAKKAPAKTKPAAKPAKKAPTKTPPASTGGSTPATKPGTKPAATTSGAATGAPASTGGTAPAAKPATKPATATTKPAKKATATPAAKPASKLSTGKEYASEAEMYKEIAKEFKQIISKVKAEIESKYPGTCKSLELKKSPTYKGEGGYHLFINGIDTKLLIATGPLKSGDKVKPFIVVRRSSAAGGESFDSPEKAMKKISDFTADRLEMGHRSYETKEKSRKDLLDRLQTNANKAAEELSSWVSKNLGSDVRQKITLKERDADGNYAIMVDGKESIYSIHITTIKNPFRNGFTSSHFGIGSITSTHAASTQVKNVFINALLSVANTRVPDEKGQGRAIKDLEKNGLTFAKETAAPKLTVEQYKVLLDSTIKVGKKISEGTNVYDILKELKKIDKRMQKLGLSSATKISIATPMGSLTWNAEKGLNVDQKKIIELKKAQFKGKPEELNQFERQNRLKLTMREYGKSRLAELKKDMDNIPKSLSTRYFKIDSSVSDLNEANMELVWDHLDGYKEVNAILGSSPFGIPARLRAKVGTAIIGGEGIGNINKWTDIEDVFKYVIKLGGGFKVDGIGTGSKRFKNPVASWDNFKETLAAAKKSSPDYYKVLVEKVLKPCLMLLRAMTRLKYTHKEDHGDKKWNAAKARYERQGIDIVKVATNSYPKSQHHIIGGLQTLLGYKENKKGGMKAFLAWAAGGKGRTDEIYLSDMDGNVKKIDEGMFQRHFNPKAALFMLLEKKGLYTLNEKGEKTINENALLAEVNGMLKSGYLQMELRKIKGKKPSKKQVAAILKKIDGNLKAYQISSFKGIKDLKGKHKLAFQLGFIQMQVEKIDNDKEKAIDARIDLAFEARGKDPSKMKPAERELLRALLKKGLKEKLVYPVFEGIQKCIGGAGIMFDSKGKFKGAGAATGIPLGDGATLLVGAGFSGTPPYVNAQIGLDIRIMQKGGNEIGFNTSVGIQGAHLAFRGSHALGKGVDFKWLAGASFSWMGLLSAGVAGNVELDWGKALLNSEKRKGLEKVAKKAGWNAETIKNWRSFSPAKKMQALKAHPQWEVLKGLIGKYPKHFTNKNVVKMYDRYMSELRAKGLHKATVGGGSDVPFIPTGFSVGATTIATSLLGGPVGLLVGVLGGIKFRLGTVVMFVPNPGTKERLMKKASSARVDAKVAAKLRKFANKLDNLEFSPQEFSEETGAVIRRPGLGLGLRIGEKQVANLSGLSRFAAGNLSEHNKELKNAEVKLIKHPNGQIELKLHNLYNREGRANKDLEVHIDPTLRKLGAVIRNGSIFLEGDIDDLIITRERFMFAAQRGKGKSTIRDIITIRQKESFQGKIKANREWIMKNSGSYAEIIMGSKKLRIRKSGNAGAATNIRSAAEAKQWLTALKKHRPERFTEAGKDKVWTAEKLKGIERHIKEGMHKALKTMTNKEWQKMKVKKTFYSDMRKLYNNKEFFKKFREITDNPDKIYTLLQEFVANGKTPKLNTREFTMAENYLRNMWFVTAYRASGKLTRLKKYGVDLKLRRKLRKAGYYGISRLDRAHPQDLVDKSKGKISKAEAEKIIAAVKKYKERPMSNNALVYYNKRVLRKLLQFKRWTQRKYIQDFNSKIKKLWPKGKKPNARKLVKSFMDGMYGGLIKSLKNTKPPIVDFRKVNLVGIPQGATLVSGSRTEKGRRRTEYRAFTNTMSYETTRGDSVQIHGYGFLEGTSKQYSLTDKNPENRQIARILLEIAHPLPEKREDVLKSAQAIQLLGLGSYRFIAGKENYDAMIAIVKNPKLATSGGKYGKAMDQFMQLLKDVRAAQHAGKAYVHPQLIKGLQITIDMTSGTVIKSGAFSKCTNASFIVDMKGKAKIKSKKRRKGVVGASTSTIQKLNSRTGIAAVSFKLFGGVVTDFKKTPPKDGKNASEGTSERTRENTEGKDSASGSTTQTRTPGETTTTTTTGGSKGIPAGEGHLGFRTTANAQREVSKEKNK